MSPRLRIAAVILLCALFHVLAWGSWDGFERSIDFNQAPLEDFLGPYWNTAAGIVETGRPAPGYYYPPTLALLLSPLTELDPGVASWGWLGVQLCALLGLLLVPLAFLSTGPERRTLYVGVALFSFPWLHNLHWGQVGSIVTLLVVACCFLEQRGRRTAAAALLGLAGSLKLLPALLLGALDLEQRRRALLTALGVLLLLLLGLPLAVIGGRTFGFYGDVFEGVRAARSSTELWAGVDAAQGLPALAARVLGLSPGPGVLALELLGAGCFALLCWRLLARRRAEAARATRSPWVDDLVPLLVALPACFGPGWAHWFTHIPLACLWLLARDSSARGLRAAVIVGVLTSVPVFRAVTLLEADIAAYGRLGLLAIGNSYLLGAVLAVRFARDGAE